MRGSGPDEGSQHGTKAYTAEEIIGHLREQLVARGLEQQHGLNWLKRGCGPWLDRWKERQAGSRGRTATSLLGYSEIGELFEIITSRTNWPAD